MTAAIDPATAGTLGDGGSGDEATIPSPDPGGHPTIAEFLTSYWRHGWKSLDEIRFSLGYPCGRRDPVSGLQCDKPVGHWRFRDGRRLHHANERHTGEMARTYPATWVHVWRDRVASRPVTDTQGKRDK